MARKSTESKERQQSLIKPRYTMHRQFPEHLHSALSSLISAHLPQSSPSPHPHSRLLNAHMSTWFHHPVFCWAQSRDDAQSGDLNWMILTLCNPWFYDLGHCRDAGWEERVGGGRKPLWKGERDEGVLSIRINKLRPFAHLWQSLCNPTLLWQLEENFCYQG